MHSYMHESLLIVLRRERLPTSAMRLLFENWFWIEADSSEREASVLYVSQILQARIDILQEIVIKHQPCDCN